MSKTRVGRYEVDRILTERPGVAWLVGALREPPYTPCLLERITQDLAAPPFAYTRFLDRARAQARLDHPQIVRILEVGSAADDLLVVYELLQGWSAEEWVAACATHRQPLPLRIACEVMVDVLNGLHAAHRPREGAPLIHGGLDLSRIRIGLDGRAKVGGFARLRETKDSRYRSSEQLRDEKLTEATDLFACGLLLYELVTGQPVFADLSPDVASSAVRYTPLPDPRERNGGIPPRLAEVVMTALGQHTSKEPAPGALELAQRIESAAEVLVLTSDERRTFLTWLTQNAPRSSSPPMSERVPNHLAMYTSRIGTHPPTLRQPTPEAKPATKWTRETWITVGTALAIVALLGLGGAYALDRFNSDDAGTRMHGPPAPQPIAARSPLVPVAPIPAPNTLTNPGPLGVEPAPPANHDHWVNIALVTTPSSEVRFRGHVLGKTPLAKAHLPLGMQSLEFVLPGGTHKVVQLMVRERGGYRLDLR